MKWIGQHIYDLISRFRNDVYLEDISTGTIASGGNIGLDSNNKIVKAAISSGGISHDGSTANGVLTFKDADEATVEQYLTFVNAANISRLQLFSNQDTGDTFSIATTTHGATTLATTDDDAAAANLTLDVDGSIHIEHADALSVDFRIDDGSATTKYAGIKAESGNFSELKLISEGGLDGSGSSTASDYFSIYVQEHGETILSTVDAAGEAAHFEIAADGNITLDAAGDIILEAGGDDLTLDADTFSFTSATSQKPEILVTDSTNGTDGSRIKLIKNRNGNGSAGVNDDLISAIQYASYNDAGTPEFIVYSQIVSNIVDKTDGRETGNIKLQVAAHGGGLETGLLLTGGSQDDEVDVTVGLGAASVTTVTGTLTMGSTAAMTNAGLLSVANQTGITGVGTISSGTWQGTAIASAYLDADTAHLSGTQTFTGAKTFTDTVALTGTGRITGVDTVSADTDAASKVYADRPAKQIQIITCNWKGKEDTDSVWIPLGAAPEEKDSNNFTNEQSVIIMPCDGHVKELLIRAQYNGGYTSENITIGVYTRAKNKKMNGQTQVGGDITVATPTQDASDNDNNTRSTGDLGTSYPYNRGDALGIEFQWASTGPAHSSDKTFITVVLENDMTTLGY